ncbi:MAG: nitrilase-related carbon-nitrogen hydrolase [Myxococcota bacterium]|nr:nitrilase-related carbon-nitrogen hydrolase [Myxococcota bacterium]
MSSLVKEFGRTTRERWALATLAGIFNGIGFVYFGPMSLIANVPLLCALRYSPSYFESGLLAGWVGFLGGVHIYGIINYGWFLLLGFSLYTASQMVIYGLLFRWLWRGRGGLLDILVVAAIWTVSEWIRTLGPVCMPASYVGNIADVSWLRPWLVLTAWIGGIGVSSFVALVQSLTFHGLISFRHSQKSIVFMTAFLLVFGAVGVTQFSAESGGQTVKIAGVQAGLANSQYHAATADPAAQDGIIRTFETLTRRAYEGHPDFVIWPETAIRGDVLRDTALHSRLFPGNRDRSILLAGLIEQDKQGKRFNVVASVLPGGQVDDIYRKVRLVPGTESHLTPGHSVRAMRAGSNYVGVMICLESVYPDMARRLVATGAEFLVIASNDAGFGFSPITRHMTNRAMVRAMETRRWLIRVGQAGISAVISPNGVVTERLGLFKPGLIEGQIQLRQNQTLFVRFGDWWMVLIFGIIGVGAWSVRSKSVVKSAV